MEKKEDYSSKENIIMETNKLVRRIFSIGEQWGEYSSLEKGVENILHWRTMLCYLVLDKNRTSEQYWDGQILVCTIRPLEYWTVGTWSTRSRYSPLGEHFISLKMWAGRQEQQQQPPGENSEEVINWWRILTVGNSGKMANSKCVDADVMRR